MDTCTDWIIYFTSFFSYQGVGRVGRIFNNDYCGVQKFSWLCLSCKWIVENNKLFWENTIRQFDKTEPIIIKIPNPTAAPLVRIRAQPASNNKIVIIPGTHSIGQVVRCILRETCEMCGCRAKQGSELFFFSIFNAWLCTNCCNDTGALSGWTFTLVDTALITRIGMGGNGEKTGGRAVTSFRNNKKKSCVKIKSLFKKNSEFNLVLRELLGDHVNDNTKVTTLFPGRSVVRDTQKDEIKRKLNNGVVDTNWNDEAIMHALKTTTSHISLGIDSAEVSSHIILDSPACSRTGCGCRAFVEVSKTLVGGVTEEEYLVGVLKIKPSKSLAVALRQFRREKKIQLEKLKNKQISRKNAKSCCLKFFEGTLEQLHIEEVDVLVWGKDDESVRHGTFDKATLKTLVFKVKVEVESTVGGKMKFRQMNVDPNHCVFVEQVDHYFN